MVDYINFIKKEFSKLTLEEIKDFGDVNKIKVGDRFLIFYLIQKNKIEIMKNLIDDFDLNVKNKFEYTPLLEACCENNLEMATLLLSRGANINIEGEYGHTPISWACYHENFEMIKFLLDNGATIPEVDEEGNYKCLWYFSKEDKQKLQDFIFKFQSLNIKKVK